MRAPQVVRTATYEEILNSEALAAFPDEMRKYMASEGFLEGTPVQMGCWKEMMAGTNCKVVSQPGTGKTLAFLLPIAAKLHSQHPVSKRIPRALIFVPTRELANQIFTVCTKLWRLFKLKTVTCCGGSPLADQIEAVQKGADILVATPGRLVDMVFDQHIELSALEVVVLDEADKMLTGDLGRQLAGLKEFILPQELRSHWPQVCAFSATLPDELSDKLDEWVGTEAVSLSFSTDVHLVSPTITQLVHVCAEHKKLTKLRKHLTKIKEQYDAPRQQPRILIFANKIKKVRAIHTELQNDGFRMAMLHGKRTQNERNEAMNNFRSGKVQILVATDVAGRGLDIKNLPFVVNYDFPSNLETYIHRIGRTGRLAAYGHAYSFFTRNLAAMAEDLISLLQHHRQYIDPNLCRLQQSYRDASEFLKQIDQIEQNDASDDAPSDLKTAAVSETASFLDHLGEALVGKKRFRDAAASPCVSPVFVKKRPGCTK